MCEQKMNQATQEEYRHKAMEHDMTDVPQVDLQAVEEGLNGVYHKIEDAVVDGYRKIEDGVVSGYQKIESGVVEGFSKMTDKFVEKFFTREGESVEDAKKRMNGVSED